LSACSASHWLHANSSHGIDFHCFILFLEQMGKWNKKKRKQLGDQQTTKTQLIKQADQIW
jgi:hypothetical protein